ncbi:geranylgeranyl reductase family protein [Corynebacterium pacaense]|uniref:geranylgeranyl reductase family protein n=1 Tax=Corynebacterium pacaense TaxID=1816684 RepID=UPI0009BA845F|nr:geranylgeranyl reductase family protein [Corynebacterium pacaense]
MVSVSTPSQKPVPLPAGDDGVSTDVLIVGAGPSGSAAAIHAARAGLEVLLIDAQSFPRDKTCGDGLTPRAVHQLEKLGLAEEITRAYSNRGLKLHGFGGSVEAPWPDSAFGNVGSAMTRASLDNLILRTAGEFGAVTVWESATADTPRFSGSRLESVVVNHAGRRRTVRAGHVIVADGVRSVFGRKLGRIWHRGEVYGIAARSYCPTPYSGEDWIHSHLELRDESGVVQPGYGWIFPLGDGTVNLGCGALSTDSRPAQINTKKLLTFYASQQRPQWRLGTERDVASALLPMGGAVSNVAGPNWMLIGDSAACVNPLNGEGIDYGLETAELAVSLISGGPGRDFTLLWPHVLRENYGEAFLLARTAARALTYPTFLPLVGPIGFRGPLAQLLMPAAARLMGNLITEEDGDIMARLWRGAGAVVAAARRGTPLWDSTVR